MRRTPLAAAVIAIAAAAACSLVVTRSADQCSVDADCVARGADFAGTVCENRACVLPGVQPDGGAPDAALDGDHPWACLGDVAAPDATKSSVQVSVPFYDLVKKVPIEGLSVKTCAKLDVACSAPLSAPLLSDAAGSVLLTLPAGFDGYLDVSSPTLEAGLPLAMPSLVFFNPPLVDDTLWPTILLLSPEALTSLSNAAGATIDPALGAIFYGAMGCDGHFIDGVTCSTDRTSPAARTFYFINGAPSETSGATDSSGYGGFINLPDGFVQVSAAVAATGALIGSTSVLVRASSVSYTFLLPWP